VSGDIRTFQSMGCPVSVAGASGDELARIEALFARYDRTFSRFIPDSELNRVNAGAGRFVAASPLFCSVLETALGMAEETRGLVDPTVGAAIVAAGYIRDFACLGDDPRPVRPAPCTGWRTVRTSGMLVWTPAAVRLDLNGVVKAVAVDAAVQLISGGGWVAAGGDLATTVAVEVALPEGGAVRLEQGGLATSGNVKRHWMRGGERQHHLIDPGTGASSRSGWTQVTVCGGSCLWADVAAKAAFLLDGDGPGWLDRRSLAGRLLAGSRETLTESWQLAMRGAAACT
jgi:thiamine biosynthesis lipoprotein